MNRLKSQFTAHRFLIAIVFLAAFLRFFHLGTNPPSLYWDEASIAYNAYAILKAGIDEHGTSFPITHFLAYGDAKPPLYIYATTLSLAIFGLSEFAIRFPSALAGTLTVFSTYFLVKHLFKDDEHSRTLALISSLLLAISPWHLQLARAAFEANLGHFFFIAGLTLFLVALKKPKYFFLSAIFFVATFYTFNAYRIFLPPFLVLLLVLFVKPLRHHLRFVFTAVLLGLVLMLPLIPFVLSHQAQLRFQEVSIFNDLDPIVESNLRQQLNHHNLFSRLIYNRRLLFLGEFLKGYADNLTTDFLFVFSDPEPRLSIKDTGSLYLIELPFLLLGLFVLVRRRNRTSILLFVWLALAIVPSAIAHQTPHALRTLQILPTYQIIISLGLVSLLADRPNLKPLLFTAYLLSFGYYLNLYYFYYPFTWSPSWQYGYKQLVAYTEAVKDQYDQVFIPQDLGRPHTYVLLYGRYDPRQYLRDRDAGIDIFGFTFTNGFGKYRFGLPSEDDLATKKLLLVTTWPPKPADLKTTIYDLAGRPVFYASQN